jgi:heme exporter protein C
MLEMAAVLGALTLLTGMLFAKVQWGTWWNWDPRQTSYLLVELMLLAYLVLRASITDPDKKATHSAAYILVAVLPMLFLVFVYPRLPQVLSLHPNLLRDGGLDASYRTGYLTMQFTILALCGWIVTLRIQQQNVRAWIELQAYGKLANRDRAAHPRVVRVVSLPVEGGPESQERS